VKNAARPFNRNQMPIPAKLYKYRGISAFTEDIVVNSRVFFSAPVTLNDPFDCKMPLDFTVTPANFGQFVRKIGPKFGLSAAEANRLASTSTAAQRRTMFEAIANKYKMRLSHESSLFCVAERGNDILMFSHYGDAHRGCCLEFDFSNDPLLKLAERVSYQNDYPDLNYFRLHGDVHKMSKGLFLTKALQWAYENEWRVIRYKISPGTYDFAPECLTGIIFGTAMTDADKIQVRDWLTRRGVPTKLYQAEVSRSSFTLNITALP